MAHDASSKAVSWGLYITAALGIIVGGFQFMGGATGRESFLFEAKTAFFEFVSSKVEFPVLLLIPLGFFLGYIFQYAMPYVNLRIRSPGDQSARLEQHFRRPFSLRSEGAWYTWKRKGARYKVKRTLVDRKGLALDVSLPVRLSRVGNEIILDTDDGQGVRDHYDGVRADLATQENIRMSDRMETRGQ